MPGSVARKYSIGTPLIGPVHKHPVHDGCYVHKLIFLLESRVHAKKSSVLAAKTMKTGIVIAVIEEEEGMEGGGEEDEVEDGGTGGKGTVHPKKSSVLVKKQ